MSCKIHQDLHRSITKFRTEMLEYSYMLKKHREGLVSKEEIEKKRLLRNKAHNNMVAEIIKGGTSDYLRKSTNKH